MISTYPTSRHWLIHILIISSLLQSCSNDLSLSAIDTQGQQQITSNTNSEQTKKKKKKKKKKKSVPLANQETQALILKQEEEATPYLISIPAIEREAKQGHVEVNNQLSSSLPSSIPTINSPKENLPIQHFQHSLINQNPAKENPRVTAEVRQKKQKEEIQEHKATMMKELIMLESKREELLDNHQNLLSSKLKAALKAVREINSFETFEKREEDLIDIFRCSSEFARYCFSISSPTDILNLIQELNNIYPAIQKIIQADFFRFDNWPHDKESSNKMRGKIGLITLFHRLNYDIAAAHLTFLTKTSNINEIKKHVIGYKKAKKRLGLDFEVPQSKNKSSQEKLQKLSNLYNEIERLFPPIRDFIYPEQKKPSQQTRYKMSQRMLEMKKKDEKVQKQHLYEIIESSDEPYILKSKFIVRLVKFLEGIEESLKHSESSAEDWKVKYTELQELEQSAAHALLRISNSLDNSIDLNDINTRVEFYKSILKISRVFEIYKFVQLEIILSIRAKRNDHALTRIKAMEKYFRNNISQEPVPGFNLFQAVAYASCGQYDELNKINQELIQEKLAHKKKIEERHHRRIEKIQAVQQQSKETAAASSIPIPLQQSITKKQPSNISVNDPSSNIMLLEEDYRKQSREERMKRHQEAEDKRNQEKLLQANTSKEVEASSSQKEEVIETKVASPVQEKPANLIFLLTRKAYNTVYKIFTNDWGIARKDIENLFEVLGQDINKATKSSHHIIKIPRGIALIQGGKISGAIMSLSADMQGHLSLPDWKDKVPVYMQSQIHNLLSLIGINQNNYSKAHREEKTQVIPIQNNN